MTEHELHVECIKCIYKKTVDDVAWTIGCPRATIGFPQCPLCPPQPQWHSQHRQHQEAYDPNLPFCDSKQQARVSKPPSSKGNSSWSAVHVTVDALLPATSATLPKEAFPAAEVGSEMLCKGTEGGDPWSL